MAVQHAQLPEYIAKYLNGLTAEILQQLVNGELSSGNTYYFRQLLRQSLSADLKYAALSFDRSKVMADVVSFDSPANVKSRGSWQKTWGEIPKQSVSFIKDERFLIDLNSLVSQGAGEVEIAAFLMDDVQPAIQAMYDKNEFLFLKLLSQGEVYVDESSNSGLNVYATANYLDKNKYTPTIDWGQAGYKPISDINRVLRSAKLNRPRYAFMSQEAYDLLIRSQEAKDLVGGGMGMLLNDQTRILTPTKEAFNQAFQRETGLSIIVVDTTLRAESHKGVLSDHKPFASNAIVLTNTLNLGRHVYGKLPEINVLSQLGTNAINWREIDNFILLKRYSETNPLREFTVAEAICMPVIDNVHNIYTLTIDGAEEDVQTEGDSQFTYAGVTYLKSHVISTLATLGVTVSGSATDAELQAAINTLSNQDKNKMKKAFPQVDKHVLTFTNAADAVGQIITVSSTGTVTATSSNAFATAAVTDNEVKVTVTLNSGAERTSDVTITQNGKSIIVKVTQAAA